MLAVDFCITKIREILANTTGCMAHLCLSKYYKCNDKLACHHICVILTYLLHGAESFLRS